MAAEKTAAYVYYTYEPIFKIHISTDLFPTFSVFCTVRMVKRGAVLGARCSYGTQQLGAGKWDPKLVQRRVQWVGIDEHQEIYVAES